MPDHDVEIALIKKEIEQCNREVLELRNDVRELVDAWKAAGTMLSFVKTAAAIVLAISIIMGAWKFGINPSEASK